MESRSSSSLDWTAKLAPLAFFIAFYWSGLTIWFYQDDFGWLNLRHEVRTWSDLLPALFAPKAHGNMRWLGDNTFFLLLSTLFGINPLPFRIVVFATICADLLLLGAIVRRLTGSALAALCSQLFWIVTPAVAVVSSWTCTFNQTLCAFFILSAFWFLLERRWTSQRVAFVLGFGALEINVVYPALATVYCLLYSPKDIRRVSPMFAVSAAFTAIHMWAAPPVHEGPYALYWDPGSLIRTLVAYSSPYLAAALIVLAAWRATRKDWLPTFGLAWFLIVLSPLLLLRDHVSEYYLTVPSIGAAIAAASAVRLSRWTLLGVAAWLVYAAPGALEVSRWHHARGELAKNLVLGVAEIRRLEPSRPILLTGVSTDQFMAAIVDAPFRTLEIPGVYLAPGNQIDSEFASLFTLPEGLARRGVVYDASGPVLKNVTSRYRARWKDSPPRMINPGDPIFAEFLGPGWEQPFNGYRAMGPRATVRMGGPRHAAEKLHIGVFGRGELRISADGVSLPPVPLTNPDGLSTASVQLPVKEWIELTLLGEGLRFGYLEVR